MRRVSSGFCAVLVLWLAANAPLWSGAKKEDPLDRARTLLEEGQLSDALSINTEAFLADPELRDAVLAELDEFLSRSTQLNQALTDFADVDISTPEGIRVGRKILDRVRALDANPNSELRERLARIEANLLFAETKQQYARFMDGILPDLEGDRALAAAERYLQGFQEIARAGYDGTDYAVALAGTEYAFLKDEVQALLADVRAAVQAAVARGPQLESALTGVLTAVRETDAAGIAEAVSFLVAELEHLDRQRDTVVAAAPRFQALYESLYRDRGIYEHYLSFVYQIITGRSAFREGIYKALEVEWEAVLEQAASAMDRRATDLFRTGKEAYDRGRYSEVVRPMWATYVLLTQENVVLRTWPTQFRIGDGYRPTLRGVTLIRSTVPRMLRNQERAKEALLYGALVQQARYLEGTAPLLDLEGEEALATLVEARAGIASPQEAVRRLGASWAATVERYQTLGSTRIGSPEAAAEALAARAVVADTVARFQQEDTRLAETQSSIEIKALEGELERLEAAVEQGARQTAGVRVSVGGLERTERRPSAARDIIAEARAGLAALEGDLGAFATTWRGEAEHVRASQTIAAHIARDQQLLAAIEAVRRRLEAELRAAEEGARLAAEQKRAADQRFEEARRELAAGEFETARGAVERATEAYFESLEHEEAPETRRLLDVELFAFANLIQETENGRVVADVRGLLGRGKDLFGRGDYVAASETYLRAQRRWADTNTTPNAEVEAALRNVRNVLAFQSQRDITVADPLYGEVSQLYNNAFAAYQDAVRFLDRDLKVDALGRLTDAERTIGTLREIVPFYKDMRILALRVGQLRDPAKFRADFAVFYREAIQNIDVAGKASDSLLTLEDLREMDPRYPGLEDGIYRAKLKLGLIKPPARPQDQVTSRERTAQARAIYVGRQTARYDRAVGLLDEALVLWDENREAVDLKDAINRIKGGGRQLVLKSDQERQFQEARALFGERDYFGARRIIERLMGDTVARNYLPLIDLKRRVDRETS
jgi:hypothetical protein